MQKYLLHAPINTAIGVHSLLPIALWHGEKDIRWDLHQQNAKHRLESHQICKPNIHEAGSQSSLNGVNIKLDRILDGKL